MPALAPNIPHNTIVAIDCPEPLCQALQDQTLPPSWQTLCLTHHQWHQRYHQITSHHSPTTPLARSIICYTQPTPSHHYTDTMAWPALFCQMTQLSPHIFNPYTPAHFSAGFWHPLRLQYLAHQFGFSLYPHPAIHCYHTTALPAQSTTPQHPGQLLTVYGFNQAYYCAQQPLPSHLINRLDRFRQHLQLRITRSILWYSPPDQWLFYEMASHPLNPSPCLYIQQWYAQQIAQYCQLIARRI